MIGYDYEDRIAPAALKAAGCSVVMRYITPQTAPWPKSMRTAEARELLAAGFPIGVNYETTANRMLGGAAAGHPDALASLANLAALGAPAGLKVWFSADWDTQPGQVSLVLDYLHAAADVLGGKQYVGLYGGYRDVAAAADAGFAIWQTVAWSGDSHGVTRWDPRAVARQTGKQQYVGGVQVDVNEIINLGALGAWTGADMTLTPGESLQLAEIHQSAVDFANWQFFSPGGREQVPGTHAWRMQSTLDNTNEIKGLLAQLLGRQATDVPALAAALGPLIHPATDVQAFVDGLLPHLPGQLDAAAVVAEFLKHIK